MVPTPPTADGGAFEIVSPMNSHGGMTVVELSTNTTYQIVEYGSDELQSELAARDEGESVTLELDRAGVRANVWRATGAEPAVLAA